MTSLNEEKQLCNFKQISSLVNQWSQECGRSADEVKLVAVSKTVDLDAVEDAISQGARDFGENRPDELVRKATAFPDVNWHFIGNIQSRQIKKIVAHCCLIHSLFSVEHACKINDVAAQIGKVQNALIEVNLSGEQTKSGISASDFNDFLQEISSLENLKVCGIMTMAPIEDELHANLPSPDEVFKDAKKLFDSFASARGSEFCEISAGMTNDWREAISHGSTIVRIGRAIFDTSQF